MTRISSTHIGSFAFYVAACIVACGAEPGQDDESFDLASSADQLVTCAPNSGGNFGSVCGTLIGSPGVSTYKKGNEFTPTCVGYSYAEDIHYTWTAPWAGTFTFSTAGSSFDTVLSILNTSCTTIACNDDSVGLQSQVSVALQAGQQIVIVIDGYGGTYGNAYLSVTCPPGCSGGFTLCSGKCVNLMDDACNCGSCGHSCGLQMCSMGTCKTCFAAGTPITMADGSNKPIEAVMVGDWVLGYDTKSDIPVPARVSHTFVHPDTEESLLLNGTVRVTAEHPFYVDGTWIEAGKLQPGDQLHRLVSSGADARPMSMMLNQVERIPGSLTTYNLEVENVHDYFADGYLVHNKAPGCSTSSPPLDP